MHVALVAEGGQPSSSRHAIVALEASLATVAVQHHRDLNSQARIAGIVTAAVVGYLDDGTLEKMELLSALLILASELTEPLRLFG